MGKTTSIPMAMVFKKFYCHKCGTVLVKNTKTRILHPGDPEYKKHNRIGNKHIIAGDLQITEYAFGCPSCGELIEFDDQRVIEVIQKLSGKRRLSQTDLDDHKRSATEKIRKKDRTIGIISKIVGVFFIILAIYLSYKLGLGFKIYF